MKGKSLIILIVILVAVIGCSVIAAAYIVDGGNTLELAEDGTPYEETVEIDNLLPGQSVRREYTSSVSGSGTFSVRFENGEKSGLNEYLTFTVAVGEEELYNGDAAGCFGEVFTAEVSGEFSFSVSFVMPESVGNDAQGEESDFTIIYTLEGGAQA